MDKKLRTERGYQQGKIVEFITKGKNMERIKIEQKNGPPDISLGPKESLRKHIQQAVH